MNAGSLGLGGEPGQLTLGRRASDPDEVVVDPRVDAHLTAHRRKDPGRQDVHHHQLVTKRLG
jgi:hypothetical protein